MSQNKPFINSDFVFDFKNMEFKCNECLMTESMKESAGDKFVIQANAFRSSHNKCNYNSTVKKLKTENESLTHELYENKVSMDKSKKKIFNLEREVNNLIKKTAAPAPEFEKGDLVNVYSDSYLQPMQGKILKFTDTLVTVEVHDLTKNIVDDFYKEQLRFR